MLGPVILFVINLTTFAWTALAYLAMTLLTTSDIWAVPAIFITMANILKFMCYTFLYTARLEDNFYTFSWTQVLQVLKFSREES